MNRLLNSNIANLDPENPPEGILKVIKGDLSSQITPLTEGSLNQDQPEAVSQLTSALVIEFSGKTLIDLEQGGVKAAFPNRVISKSCGLLV